MNWTTWRKTNKFVLFQRPLPIQQGKKGFECLFLPTSSGEDYDWKSSKKISPHLTRGEGTPQLRHPLRSRGKSMGGVRRYPLADRRGRENTRSSCQWAVTVLIREEKGGNSGRTECLANSERKGKKIFSCFPPEGKGKKKVGVLRVGSRGRKKKTRLPEKGKKDIHHLR